ncbi:MAG TPA: Na+/H+ antiporter NhaA [Candidatus Saccharimonadales bacterium]|nr:Na+/H+ antiporter NhaA [Candidatus Saccharimonadales bacterium]
MHKKILRLTKARLTRMRQVNELPSILRTLLKDEAIGGKLILVASALALLVVNSPLKGGYESFWSQDLSIGLDRSVISLSLSEWVSQGLMALFFLVVGLEIKREFIRGELRKLKTALLPIGAAVGGMVVPAVLFLSVNYDQPDALRGWAIPIATDIAFALGVLSLLGRRVPSSLKLFLLTLAIVDDIGSIFIIALFYGAGFAIAPLLVALGLAAFLLLPPVQRRISLGMFVLLGLCFWIAVYESGIHASIAGAFLGFLAPLGAKDGRAVAERLEKYVIPISTFVVVPVFAFTSLGIDIGVYNPVREGSIQLLWGIILGLVVGKVVGITLAAWVLIRLRLSHLPRGTNWFQMAGVGFVAGIGFTVSIFITELAFPVSSHLADTAKIGVFAASFISAAVGYLFLRYRRKVEEIVEEVEGAVGQ